MTPEEIVRKTIANYPIFEPSVAWMAMVRAVKMGQAEARNAALEEAARVAEQWERLEPRQAVVATQIATTIRALKKDESK